MARIRIVDDWLRSPASRPTRRRSIMVVAEKWAEQRVLMRAYAGCRDQTAPTIFLHGVELAIGPAGLDPGGEWGIHVEPPVDGRAQELRAQLEAVAGRVGQGGVVAPAGRMADAGRVTPAGRMANAGRETAFERPGKKQVKVGRETAFAFSEGEIPFGRAGRKTSFERPGGAARRRRRSTAPMPVPGSPLPGASGSGQQTAFGFAPGGTPLLPTPFQTRHRAAARRPENVASMAGHTLPLGFSLSPEERAVLDALGRVDALTPAKIAEIAGVSDGLEWMERFMNKLAEHRLDLVTPGRDRDGEPTYVLRR